MMPIKLLYLVLFLSLGSCKTYKEHIEILQNNNDRAISIKFKDFRYPAYVSIPISFKIKNRTSKDRYFWRYSLKYGSSSGGVIGILYKLKDDSLSVVNIDKFNYLNQGSETEYVFYSWHRMNSENPIYKEKLKTLIQNNNRNSKGTYTVKNLVEFKMLFPDFLKNVANSDELKFTLDPINGNKEYLTLDVKY